ncbi:MAG TPA: GntR family transcriptional regulator [Caulobacteraceae bacterium]|nr:GntR family transcriptional regulator [Caulobacteraceae bacterium]
MPAPIELRAREPRGDAKPDGAQSPLLPVARLTLLDQVHAQLRQAIMSGRFRPGQALTLRSVAEALGVSHMPVRGALHRLEAEGALGAPTGRGTLLVPELRVSDLEEIRDIRVELEGLAAARAAAIITPEELAAVAAQVQLMQKAAVAGDLEAYILENWAFHTAVYRASHLSKLLGLIEGLWLRIGPYVGLMMPDREAMIASMPNHHDVYAALERGDAPAARQSIAADIVESAESLARVLGA